MDAALSVGDDDSGGGGSGGDGVSDGKEVDVKGEIKAVGAVFIPENVLPVRDSRILNLGGRQPEMGLSSARKLPSALRAEF